MSEDEEFIEFLRRSREQVGELEPVRITEEGRVIDGKHRLKAYPGWRKVTVKKSPKEALKERIHRTLKARVTRKERQAQILEYALYLEDEGVKPEEMVSALVKELPFSERYLRKLLPQKYKREYIKSEISKPAKSTEKQQFGTEFRIEEAPEPSNLAASETTVVSEVPAVPEPSPVVEKAVTEVEVAKPKHVIPKTFTCPRCKIEIETLYCTKCFSELKVREIAKILRRLILG